MKTGKNVPQELPRIAVVGCGRWGQNLVRVFGELRALAAVCDSVPTVAEHLSEQHMVPARTFEQVLDDPAIAGIVVATPAVTHADLAIRCLEAEKHVLVEKPLAIVVDDAHRITALAEETGRVLMVGHLLQYHPAFIRLKELVDAGELGTVQYIYSNRLNLGQIRREENILWSFAPHDISMILALAENEPETVDGVGATYVSPGVPDVTTTHLTFANGIHAHVFVSWLHPYKEQKLVVVGERGMAVFDDTRPWQEKLLVYAHRIRNTTADIQMQRAEGVPIKIETEEPLIRECRHFLDCITAGTAPRTGGREALRVLRVLDAASRSLMSRSEKAHA